MKEEQFMQDVSALSMAKMANAKWKEILAHYTEPELPKGIERDLKNFVDGK